MYIINSLTTKNIYIYKNYQSDPLDLNVNLRITKITFIRSFACCKKVLSIPFKYTKTVEGAVAYKEILAGMKRTAGLNQQNCNIVICMFNMNSLTLQMK